MHMDDALSSDLTKTSSCEPSALTFVALLTQHVGERHGMHVDRDLVEIEQVIFDPRVRCEAAAEERVADVNMLPHDTAVRGREEDP